MDAPEAPPHNFAAGGFAALGSARLRRFLDGEDARTRSGIASVTLSGNAQ